MIDENNPYDVMDPEIIPQKLDGKPFHIDFVADREELQETSVAGNNEKIALVEKNLDDIAQDTRLKEEKIEAAKSLEDAVAFLNEIDIDKKNIGTEMFSLDQKISEMEIIRKKILDVDFGKRFEVAVQRFKEVLVSGNRSIIAERGLFGFGSVKNRTDFSLAIDRAAIQAQTITWIY